MLNIKLPDGSVRSFEKPLSVEFGATALSEAPLLTVLSRRNYGPRGYLARRP